MNITVATVDNATLEALVSPLISVAVPVIYIVVFVISTPCNFIALVLLCGLTKRPTPTRIYSINLCLADLLYSVTLPLQVDYNLRSNDWIFGMVACGISTAAFYCNMYCTILTTCAIALDRYYGVVHPLESRSVRSTRKAVLTCLLIWTVVFAFQIPFFLYSFTVFIPQLNVSTCFDVLPKKAFQGWKGYLYFIAIYLLFYVLPMVVLVSCYCAVVSALRQKPDIGSHRSYKRTKALVTVAACCFIICYLPGMIIQPIQMVYRSKGRSVYVYYKLTLGLNCLNCCFDPFVYYMASRELRQALARVLVQWTRCPKGETEDPVSTNVNLSKLPSNTSGNRNQNEGTNVEP